MNHRHGRDGQRFRFLGESLVLRAALEQRHCADNNPPDHHEEKNGKEPAALSAVLVLIFRFHLTSAFHHHPICALTSIPKNFRPLLAPASRRGPFSAAGVHESLKKRKARRTESQRWQKSAHR